MNRFGPEWTAFCAAHRAAGKSMEEAVALADNNLKELVCVRIPLGSEFCKRWNTSRQKRIFRVYGYNAKGRVDIRDQVGEGWFEDPSVLLDETQWFCTNKESE